MVGGARLSRTVWSGRRLPADQRHSILDYQRAVLPGTRDRVKTERQARRGGDSQPARRQLGEQITLPRQSAFGDSRERRVGERPVERGKRPPNEALELPWIASADHRPVEPDSDDAVGTR